MDGRRIRIGAASAVAGLAAGAAASALLAAAGASTHSSSIPRTSGADRPFVEVAHLPPLLRVPGEAAELRYDIYCPPPDGDPDSGAPCAAGGTVFVRAGSAGPFRALPLELDPEAVEGRYVARLPRDIASARTGFSYYAVVRDEASGASLTVPAGGPRAPQRSLLLTAPTTVDLGAHSFGAVRRPDARVVHAPWGDGPGQVGLEPGPAAQPIGGASFDVDTSGTVTVLDEAHRRLLRFAPGAARPEALPVPVNGTMADLAVGKDGSLYVLETTAPDGRAPAVRVFAPDGRPRAVVEAVERTVAQLRPGPGGPVVLQHPSGQWMPVERDGLPLDRATQAAGGRSGRPLPGGREVVVFRTGNEVRLALTGPSGVLAAWRVTSATPLGEVQLAEPTEGGLLVVVRVYEEGRDEFVVLGLDGRGAALRASLASAGWAETAPLSRFRLAGSSLYQLGSTPSGLFVDRYDLGLRR